jgi:hypothetical protein
MTGISVDTAVEVMRFLMPYALGGRVPVPIVIEGECAALREAGASEEDIAYFRKVIADIAAQADVSFTGQFLCGVLPSPAARPRRAAGAIAR